MQFRYHLQTRVLLATSWLGILLASFVLTCSEGNAQEADTGSKTPPKLKGDKLAVVSSPLFPFQASGSTASGDALTATVNFIASQATAKMPTHGQDQFIEAVRGAVLTHPSVKLAVADVSFSSSAAREIFSGFMPQVSGVGDFGYRSFGLSSTSEAGVQKSRSPSLGLTVRQLIYDFSATSNAYDAGLARQRQALAELEAARSEFTMRAVIAYIDILRTRSQFLLAEQNVASRKALRDQVSERSIAGGGSDADVTRADGRYVEALANVTSVANKLRAAEAQFAEVFGREAPEILPAPIDPDVSKANKPLADLVRLYAPARSREAARLAAELDAESSRAKILPKINVEVSHTRRSWDGISIGRTGTDTTAILAMRYDFYTGGADTARSEQAAFRAGRAAFEFDLVRRQFERGLSQAKAEVKNSDDLRAARVRSAIAAVRSMEAVQEQFRFNRGSLLDTIKTQEELYLAGKEIIETLADRLIARYRLLFFSSQLDHIFKIGDIAYLPKELLSVLPGNVR